MPATLEKWEVQPHEAPVEIDDGILTVAGEIVMPLGKFPRRMTVVRLAGGRSAIWSAIALDPPGMALVEAMGRPSFLIVPNDHHRLDAAIWRKRYPGIRVVTPPGAREAVEEAVPVDATSDVLDDPQTRFVVVPGTDWHEGALEIRRASGLTLVTNDVIGNVSHPHGIGANIMARLFHFGVHAPEVPSPVQKTLADKDLVALQFRTWANDPELRRIIVSHGDVIEENPSQVLWALAETLD